MKSCSEEEIQKAYEQLPLESRGNLAVNRDRLVRFIRGELLCEAFPYIGLFKLKKTGELKWYCVCKNATIHLENQPDYVGFKSWVNDRIGAVQKECVNCVEMYEMYGWSRSTSHLRVIFVDRQTP